MAAMNIEVFRVGVADILDMREEHRADMACQIVADSLHERGFTHAYGLYAGGETVGYGCVLGYGDAPKDTVVELWVRREARRWTLPLFRALVAESGATRIQAQTNDRLMTLMLFDCATDLRRDRILFADGFTTMLTAPEVVLRAVDAADAERTFGGRAVSDAGAWILERGEAVVAAGGVLCHYNPPWGDIYMEVAEGHRRKGYGSFLVQELKRVCYDMGKLPAARCDAANVASRATLQRAGMLPCASIVTGRIVG